jgi:hypothetical protein
MSKHITSDLLLCMSCLLLFLKLLQIIMDALKACLIVYHCQHGLGTTTEGLPFKQYPVSVNLAIALSTDIQIWHDSNAFLLPNSTAQWNLMDMTYYHERCVNRFLLLRGLVGCKGSLC